MSLTTKFWTWTQTWALLVEQLDLENEDIVDEDEMMGYANEAIDHCEGVINGLHEEYFLSRSTLTIVAGTESYDIPPTMWGHKIRSLVYYNGTDVYEVRRIPTMQKFIEYRMSRANSETADGVAMEYFVVNNTAGDPQILFTPAPTGGSVEVWHLRQANRVTTGADVIDLPECFQYIVDYCHERTWFKEAAGGPRHQMAVARLGKTEEAMILKLKPAIVDGHEELEGDMSAYEEHN